MRRKIEIVADIDELGEPEEFTWDLFPVVDPRATVHLEANGLPKIGTRILPGMVLIGKIGKTRDFDPARQPTALELQGLEFDELRSRFGDMWRDSSLYADAESAGVVIDVGFENGGGRHAAIVVIEKEGV